MEDDSPSQKGWEDRDRDHYSYSIDHSSADSMEDDLITKEEAKALFKFEVRQWIKNNQSELLGSPFAQAYKKPWTKKSSTSSWPASKKESSMGNNTRMDKK